MMECMKVDYTKRKSADQIMNHRWFKTIKKETTAKEESIKKAVRQLSQYRSGLNLWKILNTFIVA